MSDNQKLQSLVAEMRVLESHLNDLNNRENIATRAIVENRSASDVLKTLPENEVSEVLVPIGGGLFVKVQTPHPDKLIVSIGANIAVEQTKEEALLSLEQRLKELENALSSIQTEKSGLASRIMTIKANVNNLLEKQKQG